MKNEVRIMSMIETGVYALISLAFVGLGFGLAAAFPGASQLFGVGGTLIGAVFLFLAVINVWTTPKAQ